ncbi:MAG: phosphotransferase [Acidimicrobiia bacterium]|nr:phosphotransferase [Acidimicrobiia bacterium]
MALTRLAELRARRALATARIDPETPLVAVESVTNEVWSAGDAIVRVNRRIHPRLRREAELVEHLPAALHYPELLAVGVENGADWLVLRRRPGIPLVRCWPGLDTDERRQAVRQVATAIAALHHTQAPLELATAKGAPHLLQPGPRATDPVIAGLDRAAELPNVDRVAIAETVAWVRALRPALDPFDSTTLIHGDLHFQNVLWDGPRGGVTAVLDLEFSRAAPPDLDLDVFLRFCAYPHLFVPVGREADARAEAYADVPAWFAEAYPELFAHPRLLDRLRLYSVAFDVHDLLENPPLKRASELTRQHPYRRLLSTLRGQSHLEVLARG